MKRLRSQQQLIFKELIDEHHVVMLPNGMFTLVYKKTKFNMYNYIRSIVPIAIDKDGMVYEFVCTYEEFLITVN